jgi:predicted SprT family Zn-dependent metalloprotease
MDFKTFYEEDLPVMNKKLELYKGAYQMHSKWHIYINPRITLNTLGYCYPAQKRITLYLCMILELDRNEVWDTFHHELAHAVSYVETGICAHDKNWKRHCINMGISDKRLYDGKSKIHRYKLYNSENPNKIYYVNKKYKLSKKWIFETTKDFIDLKKEIEKVKEVYKF